MHKNQTVSKLPNSALRRPIIFIEIQTTQFNKIKLQCVVSKEILPGTQRGTNIRLKMRGKTSTATILELTQMLELAGKNIKTVFITVIHV